MIQIRIASTEDISRVCAVLATSWKTAYRGIVNDDYLNSIQDNLGLAVGLLGFVQSIGTIESYELLVKNEQYCAPLLFKINRKISNKIGIL